MLIIVFPGNGTREELVFKVVTVVSMFLISEIRAFWNLEFSECIKKESTCQCIASSGKKDAKSCMWNRN